MRHRVACGVAFGLAAVAHPNRLKRVRQTPHNGAMTTGIDTPFDSVLPTPLARRAGIRADDDALTEICFPPYSPRRPGTHPLARGRATTAPTSPPPTPLLACPLVQRHRLQRRVWAEIAAIAPANAPTGRRGTTPSTAARAVDIPAAPTRFPSSCPTTVSFAQHAFVDLRHARDGFRSLDTKQWLIQHEQRRFSPARDHRRSDAFCDGLWLP